MQKAELRVESDTMGQVEIPAWAYWGAQTQRAVQNFGVSDKRIPKSMIKALAFWCGLDLSPAEVAELACYIEIGKMGMPVGKQDQYAINRG